MESFFSCNNISITNTGRKTFSVEYIRDRDLEWDKEYSRAIKSNKPLWNGSVLCLKSISMSNNSVHMDIFTCEYKDIIMREKYGNKKIEEKYNKSDSFQYVNVQCMIVDQVGNLLFGTQENRGKKKLISVGGSLRNDNAEISCLNDIFLYMLDELSIETNFSVNKKNILFDGIIVSDDIATFLYSYIVKNETFTNAKQYLKRGEFSGECIINKDRVFLDDSITYHERLKSIATFIPILKI